MGNASAILDARKHDGFTVHERRGRVEDGVDRLAPVGGSRIGLPVWRRNTSWLDARRSCPDLGSVGGREGGRVEQQLGTMESERGLGTLVFVEIGLAYPSLQPPVAKS